MSSPVRSPNRSPHEQRSSHYGALAFASVVLSCFAGYYFKQSYFASAWMVPLTFGLAALYTAGGILCGEWFDRASPRQILGYFTIQCVLLTVILFASPIRGYMGIMVLPLMSQSIFELRKRYAFIVGFYLYAINILVWAIPGGWNAALEAFLSYSTAFAFTIAFTLITRRALEARLREENLRREIEAANAQLRSYAAQAEDLATTRERNRLAREIHDGVGHYLTVVKTQLDAAAALLPGDPEKARAAIVKAARLSSEALDDVRRSVGALRTDAQRPPLPEALQALGHDLGLPVTVRIAGAARPLPPGLEHALFRSAQEGLTNIRKHAAASAAELALEFQPSGVVLAVTDNGRGAPGSVAGGFGLVGIRERIEVLGGRVVAGNRPGGGFALTVEVPA